MGGAPLVGAFSLTIFADNDPVNVIGAASSKRRLDSRDEVDWPLVDVLYWGFMVHARGSQTRDTWGSINIVCARLVLPSGSSHSNTFVTINSQ